MKPGRFFIAFPSFLATAVGLPPSGFLRQAALKRGSFTCLVCGEGGDAISLWMAVRGVAFAETVRELARA